MLGVGSPDLLIAQVRMHLDLIDGRHDIAFLHETPHVRDLKVGNADRAGSTVVRELLQRAPGRNEVAPIQRRQGPVDQEQIKIVRPERLQSAVEGAARIIGPVKSVVELARDVNLAAIQPRSPDRLSDAFLVAVHLGGVDVPIADLQGLTDRLGSLSGVDLENSEAELGNRPAAVEDKIGNGHVCPSALWRRLHGRRLAGLGAFLSVRRGELVDAVGSDPLLVTVASAAAAGRR